MIKSRIRQRQREAARRPMMSAVPKADVVVTNPTHYAVALRYQAGAARAPRVVAKGRDEVAARIRALAEEHGVPLLEAPPLASGYTVVDAGTVVATHLNHLMQSHAALLLGRTEVQALTEHFARSTPKVIEDLVPKLLPLSTVQRVLQNLLDEGVHIRDLRTIVESLTEHAPAVQDAAELSARVRIALGRAIIQMHFGSSRDLEMLVLDPELERVLAQAASTGDALVIEPGLAENLVRELTAATQRLEGLGRPAALLVPDRLRFTLARLARRALPRLKVIAHAEVPEACTIRVAAVVSARAPLPG